MRLRISSIAVMFGAVATALSWFTLQPAISKLLAAVQRLAPPDSAPLIMAGQIQRLLPFYLALDVVVVTLLVYAVLQWTVGRPLSAAERSIEQLAQPALNVSSDGGGPLMSRFQRALKRTAEALQAEQNTSRTQMAELRSTNLQLMRAQAELVASDRLATVGKLAAGVAHEVGNPLSGILGYLSLLRSRAGGSAETLDLVTRIEAEVNRIDQIVRSLLELGRPSRGAPGPVELSGLIDSSVKLLSSGPEFRNLKWRVEVQPGLFARCESGPLSQVVINLLINAAQAMAGAGALELTASTVDGHAELRVRDHGPGLSAEVQARLFEPFFTTKAAGQGTGLGLAVSRHLIEAMGGQLSATNHPEGGAVFTVRLLLP
jgi:two-component system, NtrC family, sensor kinase